MAQLSDDCFAFGGELTPLDIALDSLRQRTEPIAAQSVLPLRDAVGRYLAEDIPVPFNVPPHDNSAVDGYAVYFDDLSADSESRLAVTGRAAAGHPLQRPARRGEAIRIFTGAPMPGGPEGGAGPDTVMMQEDCRVDGDWVHILPGIKRGANRRSAGEDLREGEVALAAGQRLGPPEIGVAASLGYTSLRVYEPLRVAVFSSGDELRNPGDGLDPGAIFDSNRFTLTAALSRLGCAVTDLGIIRDDVDAIRTELLAAAGDHDLLITSGGMSTGEEDHIKAAVESLGSLHFWRLAIKPGRPVALGQIDTPDGSVPFAGLPGNPVAAMVTFMVVARPLILRLSGARDIAPLTYRVQSGFEHRKKISRREFVRARVSGRSEAGPTVEKHGRSGAGVLSSLVGADGLVMLPEDMTVLESGAMVDFLPFNEVMP